MNKHFPYQFHEIDQIRKKTEALEQRLEDSIKIIEELNKTIYENQFQQESFLRLMKFLEWQDCLLI